MEFFSRFSTAFADGRLGFNLVAIHGVLTLLVITSIILRTIVTRSGHGIGRWTGMRIVEEAGQEAVRRVRKLLFWITVLAVLIAIAGGVAYHLAGRDIRIDLQTWYERLTIPELIELGIGAGKIAAVIAIAWVGIRLVKHGRRPLEEKLRGWMGSEEREAFLHRWCSLIQWYGTTAIRLAAIYFACRIAGLSEHLADFCIYLLEILSIVVAARVLTLSCRMFSQVLAGVGDTLLNDGRFRNYWDRGRRLIPFGERCFEAAVYVTATAWLCVRLHLPLNKQEDLGFKIVACIGIFFLTRVIIELLQVLLNESFGLNDDDQVIDQKGQTLVPLLYSVLQYVLYFGSVLMMMSMLGIPTAPILAGASILGLAVGLGAQSLVTDIVSGFFILFENQYLVGDHVQIGDACGTVEAVGIRLTQIRDGQGKLYIIPNGQIKGVVSFSKGYVNALVDLKVSTGTDLESVFRSMADAGRRLRQMHREVLADTQILGLIELGTSDMTVRALTKVKPGTHFAMQNEYRRLLKLVLDQNAASAASGRMAA